MCRTVLILERIPLVSLDIFEIVSAAAPESAIHVVRSVPEAARLLKMLPRIDLAFIGVPRDQIEDLLRLDALRQGVGRVVMTDQMACAELAAQRGWFIEARPFSPHQIAAHVAAVREAA